MTFFRLLLQELLDHLFKLFDQDRDQLLIQDEWIEFIKQRLTNEKQHNFAEQLESVAFCLCGDEPINLERFYQICNAKGVVDKLYRLIDEPNSGLISSEQIMEFLSTITNTRPRTGFDKGSLDRLEQLFRQTVGHEKEIRREDFTKIVTSKNPFFTERVFQIFDKDNSGSISLQEFLDSMHQFAGQTPDDKIRFLFKVYDIDGDGLIQHKELQHVMKACMEENGMQFSEEQIEDLTVALFEDADSNNRGAITYEALKSQLEKHGGLLENLTISIDRWLVPPTSKNHKTSLARKLTSLRPYQLTLPYVKNNYVYLIFLFIFIFVNVALFVSRSFQYRKSNWYTIFARACGQCLNFNCTFILILMLRQCITFLRTRGFGEYLPLDQHIYFHKITGILIFGYSFLHTVMHLLNFSLVVVNDPVINSKNWTTSEWIFTDRPGLFGLVGGLANPTGVALFFILLIMIFCSQAFVRRGGCFEVFYWTHLMYVPFWLLLILHGPNFWKWFLVPGILYAIERLLRYVWMRSEHGKTYISSGLLLPSKVTHLVIKRPIQFDFHPGDYVFVNIPAIAKYEWHPFTISSAPEQEDYMWLHIRGVGEWTNRLYEYFEKKQEKLHNGEIPQLADHHKRLSNGSINNNNQNPIKKIQSTITRTLSKREKQKPVVQLVGFDPVNDELTNQKATCSTTASNGDRMQRFLITEKAPLEKSLSMPDMQTKVKKRERLLALREYMRSESEKTFDECQIRKARLKSLGLAYLSPQNKSLAQSFRYMRNKPTIIAFQTPSLEQSTTSLGRQISSLSFKLMQQQDAPEEIVVVAPKPAATTKAINYPVGNPLEIYIDGPYGAPSSHIFRAQHAVLIGTGIGVTPFASILQSIMHRYWKARHSCPRCKFSWASDIPPTVMNLRKVDFFWINRDQRSFEWFVNLLSQLEIEQAELGGAMERFLEMHMYITSALQKTDMKAVGLQLALDLLHEKEKRDLITGLKTRTNAGRPNWDKVFKQILDQKKGKVTVFYCGPPQLGRILRIKCDQFGFIFRKESF
ncbi:NADPH oxidase 5 [Aethina tumida]|uniref:NADPH oxidase 5 n=1 Tax=Aethina tumida TaxID=116153 RepID=UPI0021484942|nr:NADPH oxidase 5 [Aethina tumida]